MSSSSHSKAKQPLNEKRDIPHIPLQDIKVATKNFTTVIGKAKDVIVYKGELFLSGKLTTVTIRQQDIDSSYSYGPMRMLFFDEIEWHSFFKHSNIVSLLGFCNEERKYILIFEYAEHGSLYQYLRTTCPLTWMQRIDICINAARGLACLHDDHGMSHGNVNCSNILLRQNYKAMIANLGVSKMRNAYDYRTPPSIVARGSGTQGYVAPEMEEMFTKESDVFKFGRVLFEVLCGRLAFMNGQDSEEQSVVALAKQYYKEGRINEIIDDDLKTDQVDSDSLRRFSEIAYKCLESDWAQRPSIALVVRKLEEIQKLQGILLEVNNVKHLKIPLNDIVSATNNFDKSYCIGSGGYGDVYKAELKTKSKDYELLETVNTVAIKRIFSREDEKDKEGFISELDVLSKCEHPNIVSLVGFCVEDDEMLLVYEHVANGSLDDCLGNNDKMSYLTWSQRLKMCIDIAQGLKYMHTSIEDRKRIIHRDLKSANILLGQHWEAKIADFGLSKVYSRNDGVSTINTKTLAGTEFYWDPEYVRTGRLKKASDIYSLGVVLFEIFSGKLAYDSNYIKENQKGLAAIARRHFKNGTLKEILDPKIMEDAYELGIFGKVEPDQDSLDVFSRIAYQCIAKTQAERPAIKVVIEELEKALYLQENRVKTLRFSLEHIRLGVEDFTNDNNIIRGGYEMLYKGKAKYNNRDKKVVVKRFNHERYLNATILSCVHGFLKEFEVLFKYKHENIIGLLGYCNEMDEHIIIYEHASKGTLNSYLNDTSFSWTKRLNICIDIANGLKFLHEGDFGKDVVIHRDLKSSNILINKNWRAKICGFEHALTFPTNKEIEYVIGNVKGSPGYSDPSYLKTYFLTKESDIYSFGVILFEILCGRMACQEDLNDSSQFLDVMVKRHIQVAPPDEIVFAGIKEQIGHDSLATFMMIAFECLHNERTERPTANDVVIQLQKALEFQEAYETREAKLHRNSKQILSESLENYSEKVKKDILSIISKGILLDHHKWEITRVLQTTWDREQFIQEDENYHSEPCIYTAIKTKPPRRRNGRTMSSTTFRNRRKTPPVTLKEETVTSSSTVIITP